tara:strand:+ start:6323 stop:8752 length:2430 start_codon:yes stop_codon:yes gene_type:complete
MKKRLSLLIIFLLFSFFLFFFFNQKKSSTDLWDIIPDKSTLIIELDEPNSQWDKVLFELKESKLINSIKSIIDDYNDFDNFIDGKLEEYLRDNKLIISYFNLSNKTLEPVYLSYKKNLDEDFIIENLKNKDYDINERNLNGEIIFEAKKNDKNHVFAFLDNISVYSTNSLIIEDIIRSISNSELIFKKNNPSLFSQVKIKNDFGNIYLNLNDIQKILLNIFPQELFNNSLKSLPKKSFFDIEMSNGLVRMNGFSSKIDSNNFTNENQYDSILNFIPSNTILYTNMSSEENNQNLISNRFSKALIESLNSNTYFEISIINIPDNLKIKNKKEIDDDIYSFNDKEIFTAAKIKKTDVDYHYFKYEKFMIITENYNSLKEVKSMLINKDFWIKNLNFNKFQKQLNESHNSLLVFDINKLLPINNSSIGLTSLQLSKIQNKYYMSFNLLETDTENYVVQEENSLNEYLFKNNLSSKPHIIFSHINNKPEVIIQDEKNIVYHLSNSLEPIWSDSIEKIISKIFVIDYYKNNKKQIVFASPNKIYGFDRKGNSLIGFPFENPSKSPIQHLNIIDYDKSKRYRIISSHRNGEIYFYDKNGKTLNGWNPILMEDELVQTPIHTRVRGKDYIIILQKNGDIYVKNRRGINYKGFPVKLDSDLTNKIHLQSSSNSAQSLLEILSDDGKLYKINLEGKIISSKDQYRNEKDAKFKMIQEASGKSPAIISYDNYNLFKDENNINFKNIEKLKFQFYNLSKNENFLVLTDTTIKKSYFLDKNLNYYVNPISNQNEVSILDYGNSIIIYKTLNNSLSMIELKK